ncbi:uncharacterized protein LOC115442627 [Manduca sexta]|uniref:Uncharacterized protein n=1 Tax=Manduca sexta TaxID=7130 RepID=A0A921YKJ8_MANSE|nr:uncharacterized protein LOC115442627 [Manduca sexta]KAG6440994.1 hypothetical protein O3G_MSEX001600 [Manduca sexta]
MIPTKTRRYKGLKLPKNLERAYKEGKCRECAVVLTRMDFAKILGKFTKVKIQYEVRSTPKVRSNEIPRLRCHENGLVHKNNNEQKPPKDVSSLRKSKTSDTFTPNSINNVLKENNRIKTPIIKDKNSNYANKATVESDYKQFAIVFTTPTVNDNNEIKSDITLVELLPNIDDTILPSEDWCIDYFPKNDEPKDDKVYDRIAAELEDLMNSGKPLVKSDDKADDFPSIMDILNDNGSGVCKPNDQVGPIDFKPDLESNDVEAMLLGKSNEETKSTEPTPMDVDNHDMSSLIPDVDQFNVIQPVVPTSPNLTEPVNNEVIENPHSPSILDEALQKGIEEHLPPSNLNEVTQPEENKEKNETVKTDDDIPQTCINPIANPELDSSKEMETNQNQFTKDKCVKNSTLASKAAIIAQVVFKKTIDGKCQKSVTFMKNLKYTVEIHGKSIEFLGAPKSISSLKDLQILLQIVNESELKSFNVLQ